MKLTGHKTEAVYRRYAIADSEALAEGVEKLAKLHEAEPRDPKVVPLKPAENGTVAAQREQARDANG